MANWTLIDEPQEYERLLDGATLKDRRSRQSNINRISNLLLPLEPNLTLSVRNALAVCRQQFRNTRPDLIYATGAPYADLLVAAHIARNFDRPLIVDLRDPWSTNPARIWPTRLHYLAEQRLEQRILEHSSAIIMNTPQARTDLLLHHPSLRTEKVHVISHGYDGERLPERPKSKHRGRQLKIGYAGGFYQVNISRTGPVNRLRKLLSYNPQPFLRGSDDLSSTPDTVFKAISKFNSSVPRDIGVSMEFIGGDHRLLRPLIQSHVIDGDVKVLPRIKTQEVSRALAEYDMLYLTNIPIPDSPFVATKTFEYLSTGVPVVANLPAGDNSNLIENTGAGLVFPPNDYRSIVSLFERMSQGDESLRPETPLRTDIIDCFQRQHQLNDFLQIVDSVVSGTGGDAIISKGYQLLADARRRTDPHSSAFSR